MKKLLLIGIAAATVGAAGIATAQQSPYLQTPTGLRLRLGIVWGISDEMRNASTTFLGLGGDYTFDQTLVPGAETFMSIDWITKTGKGNAHAFPILLGVRLHGKDAINGVGMQNSAYFFGAVGPVFIDAPGAKATVLGFRGGVGAMLTDNIFGEASVLLTSRASNGSNATSLGLYLGYKF